MHESHAHGRRRKLCDRGDGAASSTSGGRVPAPRLTGYREGAVVRRLTQWHARPGVDREEAVRYWTQEHARHVAVVDPDGSEPPYAGLGEAAFASVEDAARATESDEWAAVIADARTFMDFRAPGGRVGGESCRRARGRAKLAGLAGSLELEQGDLALQPARVAARSPVEPTTRWHGRTIGIRFRCMTVPTPRAARGCRHGPRVRRRSSSRRTARGRVPEDRDGEGRDRAQVERSGRTESVARRSTRRARGGRRRRPRRAEHARARDPGEGSSCSSAPSNEI